MTDERDPAPAAAGARDPVPGVPVVVIGLMGAGKTTLAQLLAAEWGRTLSDSDTDLELATGVTARQIATSYGLARLHRLEAAHLLRALRVQPALVIAAAASTVEREDCREALRDAVVVWLDIPVVELARRLASGTHRPELGPDVEAEIAALDAARRAGFRQIATVVLNDGEPADWLRAVDRAVAERRQPSP